ncbi:MAG: penicillin acylase family protein [Pseudomonadota bacterium]
MKSTYQAVKASLFGACLACAATTGFAETINVPGLSDDVTVFTDANGIPTIVGETELDVVFVKGYLHARDRFFQMDFLRRVPSGTLSEIFGAGALANDIELRTLGLRRAAFASWVALDQAEKDWLKAYADGVNHYLNNNPLPPEYQGLEITQAEAWSPVDSLVIGKLLAFQLSFDLEIGDTLTLGAYQAAGAAAGFNGTALFTEDLFRTQPSDDRVSIPTFFSDIGVIEVPANAAQSPTAGSSSPAQNTQSMNLARVDAGLMEQLQSLKARFENVPVIGKTLNRIDNRGASNWWLVSGEHTASGFPIMANDPHLGLDSPSTFVNDNLIIRDEEVVVSGISFPGTPVNALACNAHICWGATTNSLDVTDAFEEEFLVNNFGLPTHTLFNGVPEPLVPVFQSFFVNNVGDGTADNISRANVPYDGGGITFLVPRRNNGPILSISGNTGVSVQYTGWGATSELSSFRAWTRASNLDEFQAGLQSFSFGSQNWAYADVEGNIAYFTSAESPLRADLQNDLAPDGGVPPWFIRNGTGELNHEWLPVTDPQPGQATPYQILPMNEMPQIINPASGYIANANNDPVGVTLDNNPLNQLRPGGNGLYYLAPSYGSLRMGRIDRALNDLIDRGDITVADMQALQSNTQMLDAELMMPFILEAFENASADDAWTGLAQLAGDLAVQEAALRFVNWDFSAPTGIQEGFDPGDDPTDLPMPSQMEIDHSVAATIYSVWRGQFIQNTIDTTLNTVGLGGARPGSTASVRALFNLLNTFPQQQGVGASGLQFFNVPDAPDPATARDTLILSSLKGALDLLASDDFADAFGNSTDQNDYRWGRLHRITFAHPLDIDPFNVPNGGGFTDLGPGLPGVARGGGYEVVDASGHSTRADGVNEFRFGSGAARRTIAEMTDMGPNAQEIIPGGRSGVFLSPFYTNQLQLWLVNDYLPLNFSEGDSAAGAVITETFTSQ